MLHAGGLLQDATLPKQTKAGVHAIFAANTVAAAAVLGIGSSQPLQAVSYFSSVAAAMGSGGQANYAAANAVMDSWANDGQHQVWWIVNATGCS